jgi:Holliday junction DNA helicase RuvA
MFYYISGQLAHLDPSFAVLDVSGVGYKLTISGSTHSAMPPHLNTSETPTVKLYTYLAVREDDIELFGFISEEELSAFKMLITVSGVGPKAAISILSTLTPAKLAIAICTDDKKAIAKANGIGPKTAARIILELKDKLQKEVGSDAYADSPAAEELSAVIGASTKKRDAEDALSVL